MPIESILFDLDGTLIDSFPGIARAIEQAVEEILPDRSVDVPREVIGPPIRGILCSLLGELDESTLAALEKGFRYAYDTTACLESQPYPGVLETLRILNERGIACYILTNKPLKPTQRILGHLGLAPHFTAVITPDVTGVCFQSKAEAARYATERYNLVTERTLLVGDSSDDADAARACRFHFAPVRYGYGKAHEEAKRALSSISELLAFL